MTAPTLDVGARTDTDGTDAACHELLLRLAGRLPDDPLWRLRDWLSADVDQGRAAVGATLPRTLLRHRIGLTDSEQDLLVRAADGWGAPRRLIDAVLPVHASDGPAPQFRIGTGPLDAAVLSVLAVVRSTPGARELRLSNRVDPRGDRRIVLVLGAERPWVLTGTLQRLLRAHGDRTPHVEVLPDGLEPATYHQAAIVGSALLWSAPPRTTTPTGSAAGEST